VAVVTARRYRVEHRDGERATALGVVEGGFAHFTALDPFLAGLPAGSAGVVVLVDEATGAVVARRHLGRPARPRCGWRGPVVARRS
jgi:hypothetical protein